MSTVKGTLWLILTMGLLGVALAASSATAQSRANSSTLVVAAFDVPTSLNPEGPQIGHEPSAEAMANLFEPLVTYRFKGAASGNRVPDYKAGFAPRLATSWKVSANQKQWTLQLRKGVKSVWGNEFTADDVTWSAQRAFGIGSYGKFILNVGGVMSAKSVKKLGRYTIRYTLNAPNPLFLHTRAMWLTPIFDSAEVKTHVTAADKWGAKWVERNGGGFGPYRVSKLVPGQDFVMTANPGYYRGSPKIQTVNVKAVPSSATRLAALSTGSVDIAETLSPTEVDSVSKNKSIKIAFVPGNRNEWLIVNTTKAPLNDVRVRQAIAYALPYSDIVKSVFFNRAQIYRNVVPLGYPFVSPSYWHYSTNMAKAKALLAAAGVKGGDIRITYSTGFVQDEQTGILIRSALKSLGFNVTLDKVTPAIFADYKNNPASKVKTQILLSSGDVSWLPDYVYASLFFFKSDALFNHVWKDAKFDKLSAAASVLPNGAARTAAIHGMQKILLEQLPYIPIVQTGNPVPMSSRISGYTWYPDNWIRFADLSKS